MVAKKLSHKLHDTLKIVITAINKIKSHSLNDRIFRKLCAENDENFDRLLLHTEVCWLSKGNCLKRFYELLDTVLEFFENVNDDIYKDIKNAKTYIAYLTDLFSKFNEINLRLQGEDVTLIKTKSEINAFITKLILFKRNVGRGELYQFPNLLEINKKENIINDTLLTFCHHLEMLHNDMEERFYDILNLEIPEWVINPFLNIENINERYIEEELIDLQNDEEIKPKFKNFYQEVWLQKEIQKKYPGLWAIVKKLLISFPTSYLVERGFSAVTLLLNKQRNRLRVADCGDLRLFSTKFKPDVDKLINLHQVHPSH